MFNFRVVLALLFTCVISLTAFSPAYAQRINLNKLIIEFGKAIDDSSNNKPATTPAPTNNQTSIALSRSERMAVQNALNLLGYDVGVVDGIIGSRTRSAIRAYQAERGLQVTGKDRKSVV